MLEMSYIPSGLNPADYYSRKLTRSDAILSATSWGVVQEEFGGPSGHNFDLMAYDSNVQHNLKGALLPHFTPFLTPCSAGVNLFIKTYPFAMVLQSILTSSLLFR